MALNALYPSLVNGSDSRLRGKNVALEQQTKEMCVRAYGIANPVIACILGDPFKEGNVQTTRPIKSDELTSALVTDKLILTALTAGSGVARSAELTPTTLKRIQNERIVFRVGHFREPFSVTAAEMRLLQSGSSQFVDLIKERKEYAIMNIFKTWSDNLSAVGGAGADGENRLISFDYFMSQSADIGGITQSDSGAENWKSNLIGASMGAFSPMSLDAGVHAIRRKRASCNLISASAADGAVNGYTRIKEALYSSAEVEIDSNLKSFGIPSFMWEGIPVVADYFEPVTAGTFVVRWHDTTKYRWVGDRTPQMYTDAGGEVLTGTDAREFGMNAFATFYPRQCNATAYGKGYI